MKCPYCKGACRCPAPTVEGKMIELALGRILRLAATPAQPGDVEEYERCRALIMDELAPVGTVITDHRPNYARDRHGGAAGD